MSNLVFNSIPTNTLKGAAIQLLKSAGNVGCRDLAVLTLSGNAVDQNTFTLGGDVYELHQINTDTTYNTANGELNTTDAFSVLGAVTGAPFAVGSVLRCQSEFMFVLSSSALSTKVMRGAFGSTIATHADGQDVFAAAQAVGAGRKAVPWGATATNTTVAPLIALAVNAWVAGWDQGDGTGLKYKASLAVEADNVGSGGVVRFSKEAAPAKPACAETLTNGTISAAFGGGVEAASQTYASLHYTVVAGDVTAGALVFRLPFTVKGVSVSSHDATTKLSKAIGSTVAVSGKTVTVTNNATNDFAAGDVVRLELLG